MLAAVVLAGGLLAACSDDDGGTTATEGAVEPTETTDATDVSLSEACTDLAEAVDRLRSDAGDIDSMRDLSDVADVLGDGVERIDDAARRVDDVEARDDEEQAVLDALEEASSSARAVVDAIGDGDVDAIRDQAEEFEDTLQEARERAAEADIECAT